MTDMNTPQDTNNELDEILHDFVNSVRTNYVAFTHTPEHMNEGINREEKLIDELQQALLKWRNEWSEEKIVEYRDKITTKGKPLSDSPLIDEQPVPCPRCKATRYADWSLLPHQLYNSYIPNGTGHYCFPCFMIIASKRNEWALELIGENRKRSPINMTFDYQYDEGVLNGYNRAKDELRRAIEGEANHD